MRFGNEVAMGFAEHSPHYSMQGDSGQFAQFESQTRLLSFKSHSHQHVPRTPMRQAPGQALGPSITQHQAEQLSEKRFQFMSNLYSLVQEQGGPSFELPVLAEIEIDWFRLYLEVMTRSGIEEVLKNRLWPEVMKELNIPRQYSVTIRAYYLQYLLKYEQHFKLDGTRFHGPVPTAVDAVLQPTDAPMQAGLNSIHRLDRVAAAARSEVQYAGGGAEPSYSSDYLERSDHNVSNHHSGLLGIAVSDMSQTCQPIVRTDERRFVVSSLTSRHEKEAEWALQVLCRMSADENLVMSSVQGLLDALIAAAQRWSVFTNACPPTIGDTPQHDAAVDEADCTASSDRQRLSVLPPIDNHSTTDDTNRKLNFEHCLPDDAADGPEPATADKPAMPAKPEAKHDRASAARPAKLRPTDKSSTASDESTATGKRKRRKDVAVDESKVGRFVDGRVSEYYCELLRAVTVIFRNLSMVKENCNLLPFHRGFLNQICRLAASDCNSELYHNTVTVLSNIAERVGLSMFDDPDGLLKSLARGLHSSDATLLKAVLDVLAQLALQYVNERVLASARSYFVERAAELLFAVDEAVKDAALSLLHNIAEFDLSTKAFVAKCRGLLRRLVSFVDMPHGKIEMKRKALQTLLLLSQAPANRLLLTAFEPRLVELAFNSAVVEICDDVATLLFSLGTGSRLAS